VCQWWRVSSHVSLLGVTQLCNSVGGCVCCTRQRLRLIDLKLNILRPLSCSLREERGNPQTSFYGLIGKQFMFLCEEEEQHDLPLTSNNSVSYFSFSIISYGDWWEQCCYITKSAVHNKADLKHVPFKSI
jgi:hypothetical protein